MWHFIVRIKRNVLNTWKSKDIKWNCCFLWVDVNVRGCVKWAYDIVSYRSHAPELYWICIAADFRCLQISNCCPINLINIVLWLNQRFTPLSCSSINSKRLVAKKTAILMYKALTGQIYNHVSWLGGSRFTGKVKRVGLVKHSSNRFNSPNSEQYRWNDLYQHRVHVSLWQNCWQVEHIELYVPGTSVRTAIFLPTQHTTHTHSPFPNNPVRILKTGPHTNRSFDLATVLWLKHRQTKDGGHANLSRFFSEQPIGLLKNYGECQGRW